MSFHVFLSIALYVALLGFIFRGRYRGFGALSSRSSELLNQGVSEVWLLYGNKGAGLQRLGLENASLWNSLNTGFLAYIANQQLFVEFPWWDKMRPALRLPLLELDIKRTSVRYSFREHLAIRIANQAFVVVGSNAQGPESIKRLLKLKDTHSTELLLEKFITAVKKPPDVSIDEGKLQYTESDEDAGWPTVWNVFKGTILYVLLPCLVITFLLLSLKVYL